MKTITLDQPYHLTVSDTDAPARPGPGEALVRVHRVGICGTDLHGYRGQQPFFEYPRIIGHELGVEIIDVRARQAEDRPGGDDLAVPVPGARQAEDRPGGDDLAVPLPPPPIYPGDRCAVEPYLNCGHCVACRRGKTNCCVHLKVLGVHVDGGMREFITLPVDKLHKSDALTLDQLALVETLGIGAHAVSRATPEPGEFVLVVGAGPIGLSVVQFVQLTGARVIVADVSPARLAFCRQHFPVDYALDARHDLPNAVLEITGGELPTTVFDATGNRDSMQADFSLVAHGGRLVFVGLFPGEVTFNDPNFHRRELTLFATRNSVAADFGRIIGLMEAGRVDAAPWITHRASFDTIVDQFPAWLNPDAGVVKALVELS